MAKYSDFIAPEFAATLELPGVLEPVPVKVRRLPVAELVAAEFAWRDMVAFTKDEDDGNLSSDSPARLTRIVAACDKAVRPNILDPDDGKPFFSGPHSIAGPVLGQSLIMLVNGSASAKALAEAALKKTSPSRRRSPSRKSAKGRSRKS